MGCPQGIDIFKFGTIKRREEKHTSTDIYGLTCSENLGAYSASYVEFSVYMSGSAFITDNYFRVSDDVDAKERSMRFRCIFDDNLDLEIIFEYYTTLLESIRNVSDKMMKRLGPNLVANAHTNTNRLARRCNLELTHPEPK